MNKAAASNLVETVEGMLDNARSVKGDVFAEATHATFEMLQASRFIGLMAGALDGAGLQAMGTRCSEPAARLLVSATGRLLSLLPNDDVRREVVSLAGRINDLANAAVVRIKQRGV